MTKAIERQKEFRPGSTEVQIYETRVGNAQARFAMELLTKIAIATAIEDGEDSAGRQKLRLLTASECAQRAADISDAAYNEFERRGWMLDIPEPKELPYASPLSSVRERAAIK